MTMTFFNICFLLIFSLNVYSQQTGEITYAVKVKVNDTIPSEKTPWQKSVEHLADSVCFKFFFTKDVAYFEILKNK